MTLMTDHQSSSDEHPLFYALLGYHALSGQLLAPSETVAGAALWAVAWINLTAGYLVSILVGALSVIRRGRPRLALSAMFMPLCWLLVSAAAYRALYQLVTDPYRWEKDGARRALALALFRIDPVRLRGRFRSSSWGRASRAARRRTG